MIQLKLDLDSKDELAELVDSGGYKVLIEVVLPALLEQKAADLLHLPIDNLPSDHKLTIELAKYQGMKELAGKIATLKKYIYKKDKQVD